MTSGPTGGPSPLGRPRLTAAQRALLDRLYGAGQSGLTGAVDESVAAALARRGLAERYVPRFGHYSGRHLWRITEAGCQRWGAELAAARRG